MIKRNFSQKNELIYAIHHFCLNQDTREIFLQGFLDNEKEASEIDYKCATIFIKNIQYLIALDSTKPIYIHMSTVGGDSDSGMAIYDVISSCPTHVVIIVHGMAYSMGSIILQAADERIMMPNANFMIHGGWVDMINTFKGAASTTEFYNKLDKQMLDIYVSRCQYGEFFKEKRASEVKKYLQNKMDKKQDWYLNAEETVLYGFADEVLNPKEKSIHDILMKNGV
jgi:ATP-dependent Clp endopeptidase proteolytic subunit ClpP